MRLQRLSLSQAWIALSVLLFAHVFYLVYIFGSQSFLPLAHERIIRSVDMCLSLFCAGNIVCAAFIPLHRAFGHCSPRPNKPSVRLRLSMPCFTDNAASHTKTLNRRQHTVTAQCINRPSVIWIQIWYQKKLIATLSIPHSQHYKCPCQGQETETLPHPRFPQKFSQFKQ